MRFLFKINARICAHSSIFLLLVILLTSCGGGGGGGGGDDDGFTPVSSIELLDPTPGASNQFGTTVIQLANGNIVVSDPGDSSVAASSGAVHLYSPYSSTPIASIYGDVANDQLGSNGITALGNNNYVIASAYDDEGGIVDAGSVRLVNGSTGMQIGAALVGDIAGDNLSSGFNSITVLNNNNYVIASPLDDEGGIVDAGSVRLVDGSTGVQIGATLAGDVDEDFLGGYVTSLGNNNYVVASSLDDEGGIVDAGSVRLVNGSTGVQIGAALVGDLDYDALGDNGITALGNNNYVVSSPYDDEGGIVNAGSVRLVDGSTGVQIGATLAGDTMGDNLGSGITALGNSNYVVALRSDDEGGIVDAGSVRLINGSTGVQIGATLAGDTTGDNLGSGITGLGNSNYVVALPYDDEGGIVDAGSVRLMNGSTGVQIGTALVGVATSDSLGSGITALGNNNYVVSTPFEDVGGISNAGTVRLMNGSTGVQIGATLAGDATGDLLGGDDLSRNGITALGNNNYVVASTRDDEGGIVDAGSVRLMNGSTGVQIGTTLVGDVSGDRLGFYGIFALGNNNYVVASWYDDEGGIADAGSIRLMNGSTGAAMGAAIVGAVANDMNYANVISPVSGDYYVLSQPNADNGGQVDAGVVRIVAP